MKSIVPLSQKKSVFENNDHDEVKKLVAVGITLFSKSSSNVIHIVPKYTYATVSSLQKTGLLC